MSEHLTQQAIITYLRYLENQGVAWAFRANSFKGMVQRPGNSRGWLETGRKGCPDIVAVIAGRFVGIEVKGDKGRQSKEQKEAQLSIEKAGGIYILARSVDDVSEVLKNHLL